LWLLQTVKKYRNRSIHFVLFIAGCLHRRVKKSFALNIIGSVHVDEVENEVIVIITKDITALKKTKIFLLKKLLHLKYFLQKFPKFCSILGFPSQLQPASCLRISSFSHFSQQDRLTLISSPLVLVIQ